MMSDIQAYLWVAVGVFVAVIFPVLSGFIRQEFPAHAPGQFQLPRWFKKYGGLLLFSLITSLICLAIWKSGHQDSTIDWFTAFLLGFGWESAVEKFTKKAP
jgi:hypothetical protein